MVAAAVETLSHSDALIVLITVETLLLAALNIGVVMAAPIETGWGISRGAVAVAAFVAVVVLAAVAAGAGLAWAQLFLSPWPKGLMTQLEALGILIGLAVQPFFALAVAIGVKG